MPGVRSLADLASSACIKNIRQLEGVGYLPYDNVRPILSRVENARQLRRIELNSPQLEGCTGELWLRLIEKDFPIEFRAKAYKPQDPTKWYRVWEKYEREHNRAIAESENAFASAIAGIHQERAQNTSKIVESRLLPRKGRVGPVRPRGLGGPAGSSTLTFGGGSRTKTHNGASVMRKVRREVKEIANIHGSLSRPTPVGGTARHGPPQVHRAPQAMINDHRRAAQPEFKRMPSRVVAEHEERATFISDSEGDDDDQQDDGDDLFDDEDDSPKRRAKPVTFRAAPKAASSKPSSARSAATSLLKSRPAAGPSGTRPSASASSPPKSSSISSIKKMASPSKARPVPPSSSSSRPAGSSAKPAAAPTQASSSRKPEAASPPPPAPAAQPPPAARPLKRKAAGLFMKPRKRVP